MAKGKTPAPKKAAKASKEIRDLKVKKGGSVKGGQKKAIC